MREPQATAKTPAGSRAALTHLIFRNLENLLRIPPTRDLRLRRQVRASSPYFAVESSWLHARSIARPIGRARIETSPCAGTSLAMPAHRPANWPGVD